MRLFWDYLLNGQMKRDFKNVSEKDVWVNNEGKLIIRERIFEFQSSINYMLWSDLYDVIIYMHNKASMSRLLVLFSLFDVMFWVHISYI